MNRRLVLPVVILAALVSCHRRETAAHVYPNAPVIVISIDTLRADHLPAYGYKQVETPNIDRFRRDSILFENAYAHVPLTYPSHISMLTGALPPDNGVRNNIGYPFDAARHETIPSLLHKNGYATGAAISAYVLRGSTGIKNAFEFYDDAVEVRGGEAQGELQRDGATTAAIAERWIGEQGDRPFFFLLHLFEPHSPYTPPEPYRSRYTSSPYDGEIATADAIVGQFIDDLKRKKIYDRAVIVLMSDHGEGLNEHGEAEHGIFLYREELHVPLMLKLPDNDQSNRSVSQPVGLIDIFPTIAALTGITPPASLRGQSLLATSAHRSLYAETLYPRIHLGWSDLHSLIDDAHHYIKAPRPELYEFPHDPAERDNILERERRTYAAMRQQLDAYGSEMQAPSNIDPEEAKKLAALGYLSAATTRERKQRRKLRSRSRTMTRTRRCCSRRYSPRSIASMRRCTFSMRWRRTKRSSRSRWPTLRAAMSLRAPAIPSKRRSRSSARSNSFLPKRTRTRISRRCSGSKAAATKPDKRSTSWCKKIRGRMCAPSRRERSRISATNARQAWRSRLARRIQWRRRVLAPVRYRDKW